ATRYDSGIGRAGWPCRSPVALLVSPSTCVTCPSGCPNAATAAGRRWLRGASLPGRATSDEPQRTGDDVQGRRLMVARTDAPIRVAVTDAPGLELVSRRRLLPSPIDGFFRLHPGARSRA